MQTRDEILARIAADGGTPWPLDEKQVARDLGYSDPAEVIGARWENADPTAAEAIRDWAYENGTGWNGAVSVDTAKNVVDLLVHRLTSSARRSARRAPAPARRSAGYEARVDGLMSAWYVKLDTRTQDGTARSYRNRHSGLDVRIAKSSRAGRGYDVFLGRRRLTEAPLPTQARATAFAREVMRRQGDRS